MLEEKWVRIVLVCLFNSSATPKLACLQECNLRGGLREIRCSFPPQNVKINLNNVKKAGNVFVCHKVGFTKTGAVASLVSSGG